MSERPNLSGLEYGSPDYQSNRLAEADTYMDALEADLTRAVALLRRLEDASWPYAHRRMKMTPRPTVARLREAMKDVNEYFATLEDKPHE